MSHAARQRQIRRHVHAGECTVFAACQPAFVSLLAAELNELAVPGTPEDAGVLCTCSFAQVYRLLVGSRISERLLLRLAERRVGAPEAFRALARSLAWNWWIPPGIALSIDIHAGASRFANEGAARTILEEAVRERCGSGVLAGKAQSQNGPPARLVVRIYENRASISLDLDGDPRYRRGGKSDTGTASLRESSAAALLRFAGLSPGVPLVDGMTGSGTFAMEAARLRLAKPARDRIPFLLASPAHRQGYLLEAERSVLDRCQLGSITAVDRSESAVSRTAANLRDAGLAGRVVVKQADIGILALPPGALLITNPGWGHRLDAPEPEFLRSLRDQVSLAQGSWLLVHPDRNLLKRVLGADARLLGFHSGGKPVSAGLMREDHRSKSGQAARPAR